MESNNSGFRIKNVFACEHFRPEASNQSTLIGLYHGQVIVPHTTETSLTFVVVFSTDKHEKLRFKVDAEQGTLLEFDLPDAVDMKLHSNVVAFGGPIHIDRSDVFDVKIYVESEANWRQIMELPIIVENEDVSAPDLADP